MQALILAGGKGTRLRPLTVYTPKPVVPVMNRPFLLYQLDLLARAGITNITLSLSYQPGKIEDVLGDGSEYGVNLRFITEPNPMGTGGAYKYAADREGGATIVFNGDILTDVDLGRLVARHQERKADATIVLTRVDDPSRFGLVESDDDGRVLRFLEKPSPEQIAESGIDTINAGIYILEPSVLDLIPRNENRSFEYDVFPKILESNMLFDSYVLDGNYWRDIGNPASYLQAHRDFLSGMIKGFELPGKTGADIATAVIVDEVSMIGEGSVIKPNCQIKNSVIGPGVHVEEKVLIEDSVIWAYTRISTLAEIRGAIIGKSCHIGRNVSIGEETVLGDKTSLPDYSRV